MGIKENIKQHFERKREWLQIEVPEWSDTIHFRRPNLEQEQALGKAGTLAWTARLIIELAHTSNHIKMFDDNDWDLLTKKADPEIVMRVAVDMQRAYMMSDEDAKKPLPTTDSSAPPSTSPSNQDSSTAQPKS